MWKAKACFLLISLAVPPISLTQRKAVGSIPGGRLQISTASGSGLLVFDAETNLNAPQPLVTRVIVVFHGLQRNAAGCFEDVRAARDKAGEASKNTLVIAPQFLNEEDARATGGNMASSGHPRM